jgi:hypothetical protein
MIGFSTPAGAVSVASTPVANTPACGGRCLADGRPSDLANISWAKNAVLGAAERELEWEARNDAA